MTASPPSGPAPGGASEIPGRAEAGFLRSLADHLERWDLPSVNVSRNHASGWSLQLHSVDASADLVSWARSLGAADLYVHPVQGKTQVSVGFRAIVGDWQVDVWGCVDALRELMGLTDTRTVISRADLERFTEHGTLRGAT